jgi:probable F420-dependent oxidoreductase
MKFGYVAPNYGDKVSASELVEIAELCEDLGFDSIWATDHMVMPRELKEPYGQVLEPLITLSFIAARTKRLRLGTSIIVLPQRNPILVAKQAATLDVFSKGRVILGVGAGWAEKEFKNLGANFAHRGKIYDESIELMRALWSQDPVNYKGSYFEVADSIFLPKPTQGLIPIWCGGTSVSAVRRALRLGDGWHPVGLGLPDFARGVKMIKDSGKSLVISLRMTTDIRKKREDMVGASGERRAVLSGSRAEILQALDAYQEAGLDYFCASILHPSADEIKADLRKFSSEIIGSYV